MFFSAIGGDQYAAAANIRAELHGRRSPKVAGVAAPRRRGGDGCGRCCRRAGCEHTSIATAAAGLGTINKVHCQRRCGRSTLLASLIAGGAPRPLHHPPGLLIAAAAVAESALAASQYTHHRSSKSNTPADATVIAALR